MLHLLILLCCALLIKADLTVGGVKCGELTCKTYEYCNSDRRCSPCMEICDENHNYDSIQCMNNCQEYLHDKRYIKNDKEIKDSIRRLQNEVSAGLALICITLIILLTLIGIRIYRWLKKSKHRLPWKKENSDFSKKQSEVICNQAVATISNGKADLKLEMPRSDRSDKSHSPATATTTLSRRPAEDSTLDYAYDNPGLVGTPSPVTRPHESTF